MNLFIITHKEVKNIYPIGRNIMMVGASNKKVPQGYLSDYASNNNISSKNPYFCELTGLYYMLNNYEDEVVGLEHYRRLFVKNAFGFSKDKFLQSNDVKDLLDDYDLIMPKKVFFVKKVYDQYASSHYKSDLDKTREIISQKYPTYVDAFDDVMKQRKLYLYNMFIGKSEIIKSYADWLFDILFELEKQIDISDRDNYQKRVFGFLSERLFNVWLKKHDEVKIVERSVRKIPNKALTEEKVEYRPTVRKKKKIKLTIVR